MLWLKKLMNLNRTPPAKANSSSVCQTALRAIDTRGCCCNWEVCQESGKLAVERQCGESESTPSETIRGLSRAGRTGKSYVRWRDAGVGGFESFTWRSPGKVEGWGETRGATHTLKCTAGTAFITTTIFFCKY